MIGFCPYWIPSSVFGWVAVAVFFVAAAIWFWRSMYW